MSGSLKGIVKHRIFGVWVKKVSHAKTAEPNKMVFGRQDLCG